MIRTTEYMPKRSFNNYFRILNDLWTAEKTSIIPNFLYNNSIYCQIRSLNEDTRRISEWNTHVSVIAANQIVIIEQGWQN